MDVITRSPEETERFAATLSLFARVGFVILLKGELGAGKSLFARAFVRALATNLDFDIPSPSFSLVQTYDNTRISVAHADFYRLRNAEEAAELGLDELIKSHVVLVEWPYEETKGLSPHTLQLTFTGTGSERHIHGEATGAWATALIRNAEIESFLKEKNVPLTSRRFFEGDASSRRYEMVQGEDGPKLLMDMPDRPDGPVVRNGKPYSAIAHLAEGITSAWAVNDQLVKMGYSAPRFISCDVNQGLGLIEYLGDRVYGRMLLAGENMSAPLLAAVELLADMAGRSWPETVVSGEGVTHTMPVYDQQAQLIEVDLLPTWFHSHVHGKPAPAVLNESFEAIWRRILPFAAASSPVWVLRDFHSPNLLWMPERTGIRRVGVIDTQDALLGHPAYDPASLLQDARVDIDFAVADRLYDAYINLRRVQGHFDEAEFARAYAILGAQRASKILGIFARLNYRDGKPQYLRHMPRVSRYLARNLEHPALQELKHWFETEMPAALEVGRA